MASKRKLGKKQKDRDRRKERREQSFKVLKAIELWDIIKNTTLKDRFLDAYSPAPKIELSADTRKSRDSDKILQSAKRSLKDCRFPAPMLGDKFPFVKYFTTVKPILDFLAGASSLNPKLARNLKEARERTAELSQPETYVTAVMTLLQNLENELIKFGRIDTRLYYTQEEHGRNEFGKRYQNFLIECQPADQRYFEIEGKPRRAYRCGQPLSSAVSVSTELIGLHGMRASSDCPADINCQYLCKVMHWTTFTRGKPELCSWKASIGCFMTICGIRFATPDLSQKEIPMERFWSSIGCGASTNWAI